jgi:hypothetical protein
MIRFIPLLLSFSVYFYASSAPAIHFTHSYKEKLEEGNSFANLKNQSYQNTGVLIDAGVFSWQYPNEMNNEDPDIGRIQNSSVEVRHIRRTKDKIIYDSIYSFDEFGRRWAPLTQPEKRNKFIILSGCSFTYGNGLNDNQTLNYFLGRELEDFYPYNYGIGGTGANSTLGLIQSQRFQKQIPQKKGIFIYIPIAAHIARSNGLMPNLMWLLHTPYYEKENNIMIRKGTFQDGRYFYTKLFFFGEKILESIGRPHSIFPGVNSSHVNYFCDLVAQSKKDFLEQYPDSKFLVYLHPLGLFSHETNVTKCLDEKGITWVKGAALPASSTITDEVHPNESANRSIAKELKDIILSQFKNSN